MRRDVTISADGRTLPAILEVPDSARGLVIFAHGSGSSRHSSRNQFVAGVLTRNRFAALLLDLLTSDEERIDSTTGALRFDIALLARRVEQATTWSTMQAGLSALPIGYFGASTGAAAALVAAAGRPDVRAIVSRGGRPDLAGQALGSVKAPTLLLVGGNDPIVIRLNQEALKTLNAGSEIIVVPGAGHLFEEPGTLEAVAEYAAEWFTRYL